MRKADKIANVCGWIIIGLADLFVFNVCIDAIMMTGSYFNILGIIMLICWIGANLSFGYSIFHKEKV